MLTPLKCATIHYFSHWHTVLYGGLHCAFLTLSNDCAHVQPHRTTQYSVITTDI